MTPIILDAALSYGKQLGTCMCHISTELLSRTLLQRLDAVFCLRTTAGQQQQYILTSSELLEVNRVKHPHTCWLVDDTFISGEASNHEHHRL